MNSIHLKTNFILYNYLEAKILDQNFFPRKIDQNLLLPL